jgi:hypothetical protein
LQIRRNKGLQNTLFDPVRKKWVKDNPEEMVRQCLIVWLNQTFSIPYSRMAVEKQIQLFNMNKRFDLVIYDKSASPFILVECKSPDIHIQQKMFDQAAIYNMNLLAPYLGICNGEELRVCKIDFINKTYEYADDLPPYPF